MIHLAKKFPIKLISNSLLAITVLFSSASSGGTGPVPLAAAISENVDQNKTEDYLNTIKEKDKKINELNQTISNLGKFTSDVITKNNAQIKVLEDKNLKLSREVDKYRTPDSRVNNETLKTDRPKEISDTYILPLRKFHSETRCYGSSLNFTVGETKPECVAKEELAARFLGFLTELNLYDKEKPKTMEIAKKELIKFQQKYKFSKPGWYGIHVFNILATELRTKALSTQ